MAFCQWPRSSAWWPRVSARVGRAADFPLGVVFWVSREIPIALKRILEGRVSGNSR